MEHILAWLGVFLFLGIVVSSVQTALVIINRESCGDLSPLPFMALYINSSIGTVYATMVKDHLLLIANSFGVVFGTFCVMAYHKYSDPPIDSIKFYTIPTLFTSSAFCIAVFSNWDNKEDIVGWMMVLCALILCGAPLSTLRIVFRDKSTITMPFSTSLLTFLNAICWTSYGIIDAKNVMITLANLVGSVLGALQMILFINFGVAPGTWNWNFNTLTDMNNISSIFRKLRGGFNVNSNGHSNSALSLSSSSPSLSGMGLAGTQSQGSGSIALVMPLSDNRGDYGAVQTEQ
jgi:hypothetical protein